MLLFTRKRGSYYFPPADKKYIETTPLLVDYLNKVPEEELVGELRCENLNENDIQKKINQVSENIKIAYFKNCELSKPIKDKIYDFVSNHNLQKIGFEDCGLNSNNMVWLKSILKYLYGAQNITILEDLTPEEYLELYQYFPVSNLLAVGLAAHCISVLNKVSQHMRNLERLEISVEAPMTFPQVENLFELIQNRNIKQLNIRQLRFDDDFTCKYFMKKLRIDTYLSVCEISGPPKMEQDFFAILMSENTTLISVKINDLDLSKIQSLLDRNAVIQKAKKFLSEIIFEEQDESDNLEQQCADLIVDLNKLSDPDYLSVYENKITELICELKNYQENYLAFNTKSPRSRHL